MRGGALLSLTKMHVKKGDTVIVLEAMKMENNIDADRDGKIAEIRVAKGDTVMEGAVLVTIE